MCALRDRVASGIETVRALMQNPFRLTDSHGYERPGPRSWVKEELPSSWQRDVLVAVSVSVQHSVGIFAKRTLRSKRITVFSSSSPGDVQIAKKITAVIRPEISACRLKTCVKISKLMIPSRGICFCGEHARSLSKPSEAPTYSRASVPASNDVDRAPPCPDHVDERSCTEAAVERKRAGKVSKFFRHVQPRHEPHTTTTPVARVEVLSREVGSDCVDSLHHRFGHVATCGYDAGETLQNHNKTCAAIKVSSLADDRMGKIR